MSWTASGSTDFPGDAFLLERCRPIYETLPGWKQDISAPHSRRSARGGAPLCRAHRGAVTIPVSIVSVGPDREQTIFMK